ncbi:hypothetical protein B566_EDAN001643 [Ephemera danica]|nr:hypothetical protein B566_EDAN001643 [Ephemera danica]
MKLDHFVDADIGGVGNHDQPRVASKYGRDFGVAVVIMGLLLPGTSFTYNGEEIGMENTWISYNDTEDPSGCQAGPEDYEQFSRDPARTPYQWSAEANAGFSAPDSVEPWLPINPNYVTLNLEAQKAENMSHYHIYQTLTEARTNMTALRQGKLYTNVINEDVFAFTREISGPDHSILVIVNTGFTIQTVDVRGWGGVSDNLVYYTGSLDAIYEADENVHAGTVEVPVRGALVFHFVSVGMVRDKMYSDETSLLLPLGGVYPWSPLPPLTFAELQLYAMTKGWARTRTFALVLCGLSWLLFLTLAIAFAMEAPSCSQVLMRTPVDTVSCINRPLAKNLQENSGIRSKLGYLSEMGINTVWMSPVFKSPMKDFGYDISDFKAIDPLFGTMDDFRALIHDMKEKGIRLILDLVPNHSSDEHEWFIKSAKREEPYTDYYVWAKPKNGSVNSTQQIPQPPNNWISVFGGSAWEFHEGRGEFYLHQFAKEQPDLNYRNPKVIEEMKDVLRFWLNEGVSGFRVDAVPHLLEDEELRDEPRSSHTDARPDEYAYLEHVHTHSLPGVLDIMRSFRLTLDEQSDKEPKLLLAEVYDSLENTMKYYGEPDHPISDFPFNFLLVSELGENPTAEQLRTLITRWMEKMPPDACANWVLGNHDQKRIATRISPDLVDGLNMVSLLLPGVAVTYYGEEIGMEDVKLTWEQTVDPAGRNAGPDRFAKHSRDPQRSPMQWSGDVNAGFSNLNNTWLPVHENHTSGVNVETQKQDARSHLNVYRALVKARDHSAIQNGTLDLKVLANGAVFAFTRVHGNFGFLIAINMDKSDAVVDFAATFSVVPEKAELYTSSKSFRGTHGTLMSTSPLTLRSNDAVVFKFKVTDLPTN